MFHFEIRLSDSPLADVTWSNRCEPGGPFHSVATNYWGIVVSNLEGRLALHVRGPETRATVADCPPDAEHYGVCLKVGAFMPLFANRGLADGTVTLPRHSRRKFWLDGSAWEFPTFENMDVFVSRLVRSGLVVREPVVDAALRGGRVDMSVRSVERRFVRATALTKGAIGQIDRARYAAWLLQHGVSILDTVFEAGYSDQPHLTRSLKYYVGLTPGQILRPRETTQLSLLFKTSRYS